MDCYNMNADGNVMRKRNEVHKQAESNRAYAHFRCAVLLPCPHYSG
jgi:hypothetical protein